MKGAEQLFGRVFDVQKQERERVLLMSAYLLLIIAAYSIAKAVRDSLFVIQIGPAQLPYVYLLIAGAMGLVSAVYTRAVARIGLHRLIRTTFLIAISNLLLFWVLFRQTSTVWFYVLYVWVSLFGAITASQFWLLATHIFNPREARRVFSWIGVGGILGGILGGAVTSKMAHWFGTESLLILCAVTVAATVVLLERVTKYANGGVGEAPKPDSKEAAQTNTALLRQVRESRHLTMMVLLLSVAVIVEAFIDYEYKFVAKQSFASKDHLTAFFGTITFYVGVFSLLFQVLITNRILKHLGVLWAILMLPLGLLVAFIALSLHPALWAAALLQLVDGGFSYSIHRSGMELLYLPIPPETRNAVKGFIDMFVDRTGRAIGAVILLILTAVLWLPIPVVSIVAVALVIAWIGMAIAVKREYMHSFRRALEKTTIEPDALPLQHLDGGTVASLLSLLEDPDDRQVLYALDLLSHTHPDRWRDHIDDLIHHRSAAVRARTIAVLASWNDPSIAHDEFIHHPDYETARIAMASAMRLNWRDSEPDRALLDRLLSDRSIEVVRQAMITAGTVGHARALPVFIEKLADRRLRRDAQTALLKCGPRAIPVLLTRLSDGQEAMAVRRRIPKALALTGAQEAADALLHRFHRLDYHLGYAVLKALNGMRIDSPGIDLDKDVVLAAIDRECQAHADLGEAQFWLGSNLDAGSVAGLLVRAVAERIDQRVDRVFRLLSLIYSPQDIHSVYYTYRLKPELRPSAIEFLDNLLENGLKQKVVPLLEESREDSRRSLSRDEVFDILLNGGDLWLETIAMELTENESYRYLNAG
jgi:ATP:ADP antiporter, AAA family